jgi:long-chain acyl-CoA synthetase
MTVFLPLSLSSSLLRSYREETDDLDPTPIEDAICESRYIDQAVVVVRGADRPYNVALIVPDWVAVRSGLGMPAEYISEEEMAKSDGVRELIQSEIERNCYKIDKSRIPASFAIVAPFTAKNDTTAP